MRWLASWVLVAVFSGAPTGAESPGPPRTFGFDQAAAGGPPKGFSCARTGQGRPGEWRVVRDESAPTQPHALAQTDADTTGHRFPLCVVDDVIATDVDLSVRMKPVSGAVDQAAGIVWRHRDADNYYVVRANALEDNVVLYKVERGKRSDLDPRGAGVFAYGKQVDVAAGAWSTLRVVARGSLFVVHFNGQPLFEVEDSTFTGGGKVGVWTKADSVTHFDDLKVAVAR